MTCKKGVSNTILVLTTAAVATFGLLAGACEPSGNHTAGADATQSRLAEWLEEGQNVVQQAGQPGELVAWYAEQQLAIPYRGGLLDEPEEEQLVVTLDGSDCVIYVEMSLALARTTMLSETSTNTFREQLKNLRYRDGKIDGYPSRLHYFSDWLLSNQDQGLIRLLFQNDDLPEVTSPDIMTSNPENYPHIDGNPATLEAMREIEQRLADRTLYYIPVERIAEFENRLQTGDILGIVTDRAHMDIAHTGLVKMLEGRAGFYHASVVGEVMVDPKSVYEYTRDRSDGIGIVVARLEEPD